MLWGPFWVYFGSFGGPFGAFSLSAFVHAVAFGQNVNFCIFFKYPKGKKNQSLAPTLTLNSNNKFLKKKIMSFLLPRPQSKHHQGFSDYFVVPKSHPHQ